MNHILLFCSLVFNAFSTRLVASEKHAVENSAIRTDPETVLVTYWLIPSREAEFMNAARAQWRTLKKLNLVTNANHVFVRGQTSSGEPFFTEMFTWVDSSIPDNAPRLVSNNPR